MAQPAFKRVWSRLVPEPIERSTYVLASCIVLALLMWGKHGVDVHVWNIEQPTLPKLMWAPFAAGWVTVPAVTYLINQFDLFGMRQVRLHLRGHEYTSLPLRTPLALNHVRRPLYLGWTLAFWRRRR